MSYAKILCYSLISGYVNISLVYLTTEPFLFFLIRVFLTKYESLDLKEQGILGSS